MTKLRRHWPLIAVLIGATGILLVFYVLILDRTNGHFTYVLDDPYIHLTIARNLVQNGTWGINPHQFTSASSSLIWPLLLAACLWLFGNNDLYPLLLNIVLALALIAITYRLMDRRGIRGVLNLVILTILFFAAPMPALVFSGMEHVLQTLVTVLFAYAVVGILIDDKPSARSMAFLLVMAPMVTATRYEGMFIIIVACLLISIRRRLALSVGLAFMAALPILIFGLISLSNSGYFLPNSVILKGFTPTNVAGANVFEYLMRIVGHVQQLLLEAPHLFWIVITGAMILTYDWVRRPREYHTFAKVSWTLFILSCLLHVAFASVGWFFRYEAYLVYWGAWLIALTVVPILQENRVTRFSVSQIPFVFGSAVLAGTILLLLARSLAAAVGVPIAATNIFQQQYQMSQFAKQYYEGQVVAINDIGAVGYRSGVTIVDLFGLASHDVVKLRQSHNYTPIEVEQLANAKNVGIAIVYDEWFTDGFIMNGLPRNWVRAGTWKIHNNVVAGSDTVSFYAVRQEALPGLVANLQAFSPQLPAAVEQAGMYTARP